METLKYTTQIRGKNLPIPDHILEKLDADAKVEVVFRPIRRSSPDRPKMEQQLMEHCRGGLLVNDHVYICMEIK